MAGAVIVILIEIILFWTGIYYLKKYDETLGIRVDKKEYILIAVIFTFVEVLLFSKLGCGREFDCHSLIMFYLIFCAYIDQKTTMVYRIGSVIFVILSIVTYIVSLTPDIYVVVEKTMSISIFTMVVLAQGLFAMMGMGDVFTYIGVFFWLGTWQCDRMAIELLAVYMLIANILFVICNVRNIAWKNLKLKKEAAFLPSMAGAAFIMELMVVGT